MKKITIIFGTEMGTAEGCALQISELLTSCNLDNEVIDMDDYDHARLLEQGLLIVGARIPTDKQIIQAAPTKSSLQEIYTSAQHKPMIRLLVGGITALVEH